MNKVNNFLWGASTSGFQVEGGYNLDGKGLSTTDVRQVKEGIADCKVASDHYHHFKEDILLMKELGLKAYRFSFCWIGSWNNFNFIHFFNRSLCFFIKKFNIINFIIKEINTNRMVILH